MKPPRKPFLHNYVDSHKKSVLNLILFLTVFGALMFTVINYKANKIGLANLELMVAITSMGFYLYLKKSSSLEALKYIALAYVLMFCCIVMFAFYQTGISISVYTFALIVPLMSHVLLGAQVGSLITAVFLMAAYGLFTHQYGNHEVFNHPASIAHIATVILLLWGLSFSYELANKKTKEKLLELASCDFLTGLYNRYMIKEVFENKLKESIEQGSPICMIVADLDGFKHINDTHGHDVGDLVIKEFANILKKHCAQSGTCFRLGGEEFCAIFSQIDKSECQKIAEKIRHDTENMSFIMETGKVNITVSIGLTVCNNRRCSITALLRETDHKMYQAKTSGRNQVAV